MLFFFFFKQKTAYEMRISDWSSDVCSSDLRLFALLAAHAQARVGVGGAVQPEEQVEHARQQVGAGADVVVLVDGQFDLGAAHEGLPRRAPAPAQRRPAFDGDDPGELLAPTGVVADVVPAKSLQPRIATAFSQRHGGEPPV